MNRQPDYVEVYAWRQTKIEEFDEQSALIEGAKIYYKDHPHDFINHWIDTFDPRNVSKGLPSRIPLLLYPFQVTLVDFFHELMLHGESGLIEKSRDMGVTWVGCAYSVWLWLFREGASIGWGSRKEQLVDRIGDMDSIFEKIRSIIKNLPPFFLPKDFDEVRHMPFMRVLNPDNDSSITGEAGDNIGRGGRKLIYFKDESAHYERPEKIEAALSDNTRTQIDISSVNGVGNVFHRRREAGIDWDGEVHRGKTHIFTVDWRDHPDKDEEWYNSRKDKAEAEGLLHVFRSEVDRDYTASVEGIIILGEWVEAAIDAHIKLGIEIPESESHIVALDVADGGRDSNALAHRKFIVLREVKEWGERDTGVTARRTIDFCRNLKGSVELQYDCIGVGSGVKSEINRLRDDDLLPENIEIFPWDASAQAQYPDEPVNPLDSESRKNKDNFQGLKGQAWFQLQRRFEKTFKAVTAGIKYSPDELISIDSKLPNLHSVKKELSQPTFTMSSSMRLNVNKAPDGTKSPNKADAIVMAYWPVIDEDRLYTRAFLKAMEGNW